MSQNLLAFFPFIFPHCISFAQKAKPLKMVWCSWTHFHVNTDEKMIRKDALISSGLHKAGCQFINRDDGYPGGRVANGKLFAPKHRIDVLNVH